MQDLEKCEKRGPPLNENIAKLFQNLQKFENLLKEVLPPDHINGLEANKVNSEIWQQQPWESAVTFGNAVVNAVLCWFYNSKKNAAVKVFTYAVFLFRFYSVVDNS